MAKNTGASKFRKVNVDEYDEENFQDNEDSDVGVVGPNENEVTNFLNQCILYRERELSSASSSINDRDEWTYSLVTNGLIKNFFNVYAFYLIFNHLDRVTLFNYDFSSI